MGKISPRNQRKGLLFFSCLVVDIGEVHLVYVAVVTTIAVAATIAVWIWYKYNRIHFTIVS